MSRSFDIVIAGAGCAGLSLAAELVSRGVDKSRSIALFEPRTEFARDRTFCFWDVSPHLFSSAVSHRWTSWRVRGRGDFISCGSSKYAYCHLRGDDFYAQARASIDLAHGATLHLGASVLDITDKGTFVHIETSAGPVRANVVFDGRTAAPINRDVATRPSGSKDSGASRDAGRESSRDAPLLQHFLGMHVRVEQSVFGDVATLMDFHVSQEQGIHFMYVLPYSPTEALVEDTYFSFEPLDKARYRENIRAYLEDEYGVHACESLHEEYGVIPMSTEPCDASPSKRVRRIGTLGGLVKPSTGYAFLAIQRFSQRLAADLARREVPTLPAPRARRSHVLDRAMLRYLRQNPASAPEVFAQLFERVPPDTLVRFLSDVGTIQDDLRVMNASPRASIVVSSLRSAAGFFSPLAR